MPADPAVEQLAWQPQPQAADLVADLLAQFCEQSPDAGRFARRLLEETGTRLIDWTDHLGLPWENDIGSRLEQAGFVRREDGPRAVWRHPGGLFPQLVADGQPVWRLALRAESVADFLVAQGMSEVSIDGPPLGPLRKALLSNQHGAETWIIERHGFTGWEMPDFPSTAPSAILWHQEAFRRRRRGGKWDSPHLPERPEGCCAQMGTVPFSASRAEDGFQHAANLVRAAVADLDTGRAADLFFAAERDYWLRRNRAARCQKARQDALGLGWLNHDHHTYRSSRTHFAALVAVMEQLGLACRERFYAGREAGWGAQVLEQAESGIVVFADVDLGPEEVVGDFAHQPLPARDELGTVGLWCLLHGEAMLQAGLHHLACRFDFDAARQQLQTAGVPVLKPFTDLPYLKQAFTEGEPWPVEPEHIEAALVAGAITPNQAGHFRQSGAIGSHLEILVRHQGYKGFNQAGINEIIRATDPRRQQGPVLTGA